ncbi:Zinc finger protein [Globisporangium polare]
MSMITSTGFQLPAITNLMSQQHQQYAYLSQQVLASSSTPAHSTTVYKCEHPGCDRQFNRKYTLAEHAMTHTGEKPHVCPVPTCAKSFSTSGNLSRHKRLHGYIEPLKCPVQGCVCTFPSNNKLSKHMKFHFGSEDVKVCVVVGCGKTFSTTGNLNRHMKAVHEGVAYEIESVGSRSTCGSPATKRASFSTRSPTAADQWMPHQPQQQQPQRTTGYFEPEAPWLSSSAALPYHLPSIASTTEDGWNNDVFDALTMILDEQEAAAAAVSSGSLSALLNCNMGVFQNSLQFAPAYSHRF